MSDKLRIGGLRHAVFGGLRQKLGVRNYRILGGAAAVALVAIIAVPLAISINKGDSFAASDNLESVIDIRFLNTQSQYSTSPYNLSEEYDGNEANLIKTKDGKYVLIDTGNPDLGIRKRIKAALKEWQNSDSKVVIDYLIVSHSDKDHYGNAASLINDEKIEVKNVVMKYEAAFSAVQSGKKDAYNNVVRAHAADRVGDLL